MGTDTTGLGQLMERVDGAMAIVTTAALGRRDGCLVGFHCQCSIEPPRYAVWLSKANRTYRTAVHATHMAIHFIGPGDRPLAVLFGTTTGDDVDKFQSCSVERGPAGVPLLADCRNRVVGRRLTMLDDGSDHVCFVIEPDRVDVDELTPMRLHEVVDLPAGHDAEDRPG